MIKKIIFLVFIAIFLVASCSEDRVNPLNKIKKVEVEFFPKLSQLNIFEGNLSDLNPFEDLMEYDLATPLYTDYCKKKRLLYIPKGKAMKYNGNGLPIFPDSTLLAKTFYYNEDDRSLSLGKYIIETRILIKINGSWKSGNYKWNDSQTDADLIIFGQDTIAPISINWIDDKGDKRNVNYQIPSNNECLMCHQVNGNLVAIGTKLRNLNFVYKGSNQLQDIIDKGVLKGAPSTSQIKSLPIWDDDSFTVEERARAYLDVNCSHCHSPMGYASFKGIDFRYDTPFAETKIQEKKGRILMRFKSLEKDFGMPYRGRTIIHAEGLALLEQYINSL